MSSFMFNKNHFHIYVHGLWCIFQPYLLAVCFSVIHFYYFGGRLDDN